MSDRLKVLLQKPPQAEKNLHHSEKHIANVKDRSVHIKICQMNNFLEVSQLKQVSLSVLKYRTKNMFFIKKVLSSFVKLWLYVSNHVSIGYDGLNRPVQKTSLIT